jgi:hypothetical protein
MKRRELTAFAACLLVLLGVEAALSHPAILFGRYLWFDELQIKLIASQPGIWHSIVAVAHAGDETPPTYYLLARAAWWVAGLLGASGETAFRALAFAAMWIALVLTYAVLRRSFSPLPALLGMLALWACPLTVKYAFFARSYAILMASAAAFCLAYGVDRVRRSSAVAIALTAMLVCGFHYFGIFAFALIVVGDAVTSRESWQMRLKRLAPAAAGPLAWIAMLPIFRAQIAGYQQRTFLWPLTGEFARAVIFSMFRVPVLIILALLAACLLAGLPAARSRKSSHRWFAARSRLNLQPVMGMLALLLIPITILLISMLENHFVDRYMITALLGLTPIVALIASRLSRPIQLAAAAAMIVLGAMAVRDAGAGWARWQAHQDDMLEECTAMASDGFPVVVLTSLEAYPLYEYAPQLRDKLYFVDLLPSHRSDLSPGTLNDATCFRKWQSVVPGAPRLVTMDELAQIGNFHVVFKTEWPLMKNGFLPFRKVAGFGTSGVFQVEPGYRKMLKDQAEAAESNPPATPSPPSQDAEADPQS